MSVLAADDLPIMRLHRGDYLRTTLGWPPIARLVYIELLMVQWDRGALPVEPKLLRTIVPGVTDHEWQIAWPLIEPHLPIDEDTRRNQALAQDRDRTIRVRKSRRQASAKAHAARWGMRDAVRDADDPMRDACQPEPEPEPEEDSLHEGEDHDTDDLPEWMQPPQINPDPGPASGLSMRDRLRIVNGEEPPTQIDNGLRPIAAAVAQDG